MYTYYLKNYLSYKVICRLIPDLFCLCKEKRDSTDMTWGFNPMYVKTLMYLNHALFQWALILTFLNNCDTARHPGWGGIRRCFEGVCSWRSLWGRASDFVVSVSSVGDVRPLGADRPRWRGRGRRTGRFKRQTSPHPKYERPQNQAPFFLLGEILGAADQEGHVSLMLPRPVTVYYFQKLDAAEWGSNNEGFIFYSQRNKIEYKTTIRNGRFF